MAAGRYGAAPAPSTLVYVLTHLILVPAALGALAWALQYGPLDMAVTARFADAGTHVFAWRSSEWLDIFGHLAARSVPVLLSGLAIAVGCAGFLVQDLKPWRAILLVTGGAMLAGPAIAAVLKTVTSQHCPADLQEFGGVVSYAADRAAPFWASSRTAAGRCLPSGHAAAGYALLALYFTGWSAARPTWRWAGLAVGVMAGVAFSLVRVMQGAVFLSATVWSATIDWTISALLFLLLLRGASAAP